MNALTKRVIMFTLGLMLAGAIPASAVTRHVVVVPRVGVYRPLVYDRYRGPWYPYAYGYPYGYGYPYHGAAADIRTEITPKNAEVYVDGYFAGRANDFDGAFQALHVVPGGHAITVRLDGIPNPDRGRVRQAGFDVQDEGDPAAACDRRDERSCSCPIGANRSRIGLLTSTRRSLRGRPSRPPLTSFNPRFRRRSGGRRQMVVERQAMNVTRVLVVEDDTKVASFIQKGLEQEGLAVDVLNDGEDAGAQAQIVDYDCVVLDLLLPGRSGFQVLRDIRSRKADLPVLILSAQASPEARVAGLDGGADDYMDKPFILAEVSARIRALLRRGKPRDTKLRAGDLEVDTIRRRVTRAGQPIDLKPKEYALLEFLVHNWDRPVTRSHIIEHVWDIHFDSISNVVEVHINSLRNKIDRGAPTPLIHTIRGVGYMLSDKPRE